MKLRHIILACACVLGAWDTAAFAAVTLTGQDPARQIAVANQATGMAVVTNAGRDRLAVRATDGTATRTGYCIELGAPATPPPA